MAGKAHPRATPASLTLCWRWRSAMRARSVTGSLPTYDLTRRQPKLIELASGAERALFLRVQAHEESRFLVLCGCDLGLIREPLRCGPGMVSSP